MLFDRDPIPLNLYLGATLRFFQGILHTLMDLVAAAQLSFPVVCTDASLLSNCFAQVTEMLLCCSACASLDQKSPVASFYVHSSISSFISTKETHNQSSKVRFKPATMILLDTSSCHMYLSACSNNSCVSTAMGSVLSLPVCIFGKIKRALAVDRGKCQAFL